MGIYIFNKYQLVTFYFGKKKKIQNCKFGITTAMHFMHEKNVLKLGF